MRLLQQFWLQLKLVLVLLMSGFHGFLGLVEKNLKATQTQNQKNFIELLMKCRQCYDYNCIFVVFKPI